MSAEERAPNLGDRTPRGACARCGRPLADGAKFCPFDGEQVGRLPQPEPLVGSLIDGRYEVKAVLGHGGMGIVYAVRHGRLGRELALKVLRKDLSRDTDLCKRFIQEARTAAAVDHPGIVQITDFGVLTSGQPYFVMELLQGCSLSRLMAEVRPLPLDRMIPIIEQLIDALGAAHAVQVIHRDLKPDNVQIITDSTGRDVVKILDFGLARVAGASRLTKQGFVFGTPHYMSPEQAQGDTVDHRADIYSLGVLMYELTTGRVPFDADSYMGVLARHISMAPITPSKILGHRKIGALEDIILRCLEKRPHRRYSSLVELSDELKRVVRRSEAGIHIAPRRQLALHRWTHERPIVPLHKVGWGSIVAGAAVASAAGWWVASVSESPRPSPAASAGPAPLVTQEAPLATQLAKSATGLAATGRKPGTPGQEPVSAIGPAQRVSIEALQAEETPSPPGAARAPYAGKPARTKPEPAPVPTSDIIDPWAETSSQ